MNSGRSLAMNSASSEITNSTRKSHNDQKPRLFVLKLRQRRALSGENSKPRGSAVRPIGPAGSASGLSSSGTPGPISASTLLGRVLTSTSHLSRFEIDARIDPGIGEVGNQIYDEANQRENIEIGEHHRIIAVEHAFEAQQPEAVQRENGLDQKRAGEEGGHERGREAGDHQQ